MSSSKLKDTLRPIVIRYGLERVRSCLRSMELEGDSPVRSGRATRDRLLLDKDETKMSKRKGSKATASDYVSKLDVPDEKRRLLADVATKFDRKLFLPTIGDIGNFCHVYGIEQPTSKSRAGVISRLFFHMAKMETEDVRKFLEDGMYSGPSQLGPISDAIRRTSSRNETSRVSSRPTQASSIQRPKIGD